METFYFKVEKLGPIKSATFTASHLNVLCGKNNSGKSFLIHAVYCVFQYLQNLVVLAPKDVHVQQLMEKSSCEFSADEYFIGLNDRLDKAMPEIVKRLPGLMNKSRSAFEGCTISVRVNEEYVASYIRQLPLSFTFQVSNSLKVVWTKPHDSCVCRVVLENGAEQYPSEEVVRNVMSFAVRQLIGKVLPAPVLLTAERSGVVAFASDVMSFAMSRQTEPTMIGIGPEATAVLSSHYPMAMIQELVMQNEIRQVQEGRGYLMAPIPEAERFYKWFKMNVLDGDVVAREGKLYYVQSSNNLDMPLSDASSSVKALASLNYFVHYRMAPGSLLMIDEPELNLHPERQRMLMRALARMAKTLGVGIVISTHSMTMVRELNTLLSMGEACSRNPDLAKKYGYETDELLGEADVSCGIVEEGTIHQQDKGVSRGFYVQSFDDASEAIASVQSAIVATW